MGKIVMFDYGHGGKDNGASLGNRLEKTDVLNLGKDIKKVIEKHGVKVDETRVDDRYISLTERCNKTNKKNYDYFISFHRNAFNTKARGVETYTYTARKPQAVAMANEINKGMVNVGFKDRGVKSANFTVLAKTKTPAVLMEVGFIDNKDDNKLYDDNYNMLVQEIAKGILTGLGIKPDIKPDDKTFYRVVTGSFNSKENAIERVEQLKLKGFNSFIDIYRG